MSRSTRQNATSPDAPKAEGFTPKLDGVGDSPPPEPIGAAMQSLLRWHPERWHVMHGRLIPQMSGFPLQAGVNNVRRRRDGTWIVREATAVMAEKGWHILPSNVDGPGTSYFADERGTYRWQRRFPGSTAVQTNEREYADWVHSLIDRGVIEPIRGYVAERLAEQLRQEIGQLADQVAKGMPSAAPLLERLRSDLAVIEAAIAKAAA